MKTCRFTVFFRGIDYMSEDIADALHEAGCEDCSPGSHGGRAYADFARQAESLEAALASAAADVKRAGYAVDFVQIDDTDVAGLSALTGAADRSNRDWRREIAAKIIDHIIWSEKYGFSIGISEAKLMMHLCRPYNLPCGQGSLKSPCHSGVSTKLKN